MTVLQVLVLAYLYTQPNNSATVDDVIAYVQGEGFAVDRTSILADVTAMAGSGDVSYDLATDTVTGARPQASLTVAPVDPNIPSDVTAGLNAIFDGLGGGASLASFLATIRADGLGTADTRVGVYVAKYVALGAAVRLDDARLRAPLIRAARVLEHLEGALVANP